MQSLLQNRHFYIGLITALCLLIFTLDLRISLGVSIGVVYLLPVLIAKRLPGIKATIWTALVCTGLITFGLYFAPADGEIWQILGDRALALFVIWMATGFNIERKQTEEALQKSHALYSLAEELGKLGHWEWDKIKNKMVSCSEQFAKIHEMTVDEVLAYFSSWEQGIVVVHPDDRERYIRHGRDSAVQRVGMNLEYRVITPSGKIRHVHDLGKLVLDDEGRVTGSIAPWE